MFGGVFAIFGHGNVVALAEALQPVQDSLPTWRGHNEQSMALAAIAYAKAMNRRQIMVATSSIGPGSTNMVTAAAVAHANRLPVLLISGDTFQHRLVDPVLQQVEVFGDPTMTVSDAFRPVTRYWDRITHPAQILQSLPQALAMMLDPADCGPAYIALPQDIAAEAFDYPAAVLQRTLPHRSETGPGSAGGGGRRFAPSPLPATLSSSPAAASTIRGQSPALTDFAERRGIPVTETVAGKSTLLADHPNFAGPIGVTGSTSANLLAAEADVVLAIGTRLQDFTTGSWSVFRNESMKLVAINAARFDAHKHRAISVVGDARVSLEVIDAGLGEYAAPPEWLARTAEVRGAWYSYLDEISAPEGKPTYAKVIRAVNEICDPTDYLVSAAGGLPGELNTGWHSKSVHSFDSEYGYSTMGYEIAGAWGAKMALPDRDVICWTGDGSYLMMNSDIYSTVMTGHKVIFIVCDNGGFAVINRLQVNTGGEEFNNLLRSSRRQSLPRVDFAKHAEAMGAIATKVETIAGLKEAFAAAKQADRSSVIVIEVDEYSWTSGGAWWEVGVPEVSDREQVRVARAELEAERKHQRVGI